MLSLFCFTCLAWVGGICGVSVVVWVFVGLLVLCLFSFSLLKLTTHCIG